MFGHVLAAKVAMMVPIRGKRAKTFSSPLHSRFSLDPLSESGQTFLLLSGVTLVLNETSYEPDASTNNNGI